MSNQSAGPPMPPPHGGHHQQPHYGTPRRGHHHHPNEYHYQQQYYAQYQHQMPPQFPYGQPYIPYPSQQWYPQYQHYPNHYPTPPPAPQTPRHYQQHPHSSPLIVSSYPSRPSPARVPSFHTQHLQQPRSPLPTEHHTPTHNLQPAHAAQNQHSQPPPYFRPQYHNPQHTPPQPQSLPQQQLQPQQFQSPSRQVPPEPARTPSTHSQAIASSSTTPVSRPAAISTPPFAVPPELIASVNANPLSKSRKPRLTLPWTSVPESEFPSKAPRRRLRKRQAQAASFEFPARDGEIDQQTDALADPVLDRAAQDSRAGTIVSQQKLAVPEIAETAQSVRSDDVSELEASSTQPTTPASSGPLPTSSAKPIYAASKPRPILPVVPIIPRAAAPPAAMKPALDEKSVGEAGQGTVEASQDVPQMGAEGAKTPTEGPPAIPPAPVKPTSWAALLRAKQGSTPQATSTFPPGSNIDGDLANGILGPKVNSLSETLRTFDVHNISKVAFLEPRGLFNTGNMCYMNSILQTLMFCVPFYEFLDQINKRHVHSFNSATPLLEAMIMLKREFNVIDTASVEQLRLRLKDAELEQYGDAFIPEYVYDVIKRLPRFSTMRRGHQQDAEEFLGFLLEGLHDECVQVIKNSSTDAPTAVSNLSEVTTPPPSDSAASVSSPGDGWLEVGPKQRAAVTRSSGSILTESPVTKIFGGKLRSEFRVPGLKNSVTNEPFQPLQLDIGDPSISNITDALKGLTRSEAIHGEFNSPRGPNTTATKQVFIETLPPVLILHLKRFQYDNSTGSQKIWKRIGYPLELEIPKEVFPQQIRSKYALSTTGLPKYRLIGVVYHHGKSAAGGHYTVDVRRQEGREWVRFDDTIVRRVRSDDVAGEGGEEDPKVLAAALEQHKRDQSIGRNIYDQAGFGNDEDKDSVSGDQSGWSQVNGSMSPGASAKKWSSLGKDAGTASPSTTGKQTPKGGPGGKTSVKDNKVAYILFYQRIGS